MRIVYSPQCLSYSQPGHPESPERVSAIYELLKDAYEFAAPEPILENVLLETHTRRLIDTLKSGSFYDSDTPAYPHIYETARLSVGAAVRAMELALGGESAFSLSRPPGHHAGRDYLGGFCYLNNVATAVTQALKRIEKVAIIDFDCHHGDGTEDIFFGNERVLFVSLHESPLFPGTGLSSRGNCLNYTLQAGTTETDYLPAFDSALEQVSKFDADLIAVSAGFDAHEGQPIANLQLATESFGKIGQRIVALKKPTFSVLEGGYCSELAVSVREYLLGLSGRPLSDSTRTLDN